MKFIFLFFFLGWMGSSYALPTSCQDFFAEKPAPPLSELPGDLKSIYDSDIQNLNPLKIALRNKQTQKQLEQYGPPRTGKRMSALPYTNFSKAHQFISEKFYGTQMDAYEKDYCSIGYCFGRAYLSHILLLKLGLQPDSIRKVWAVGPMNTGTLIWDFHVAIAAYVKDFGWMVLDSNFESIVSLKDWISTMTNLNSDGKVRIYITDPRKFGISHGRYSRFEMGFTHSRENDWYSHYFPDNTDIIRSTSF